MIELTGLLLKEAEGRDLREPPFSGSTYEREREDVQRKEIPPLVGHRSNDPAKRVALCGAAILGVKAFGDYVVCERCLARASALSNAPGAVPFKSGLAPPRPAPDTLPQ